MNQNWAENESKNRADGDEVTRETEQGTVTVKIRAAGQIRHLGRCTAERKPRLWASGRENQSRKSLAVHPCCKIKSAVAAPDLAQETNSTQQKKIIGRGTKILRKTQTGTVARSGAEETNHENWLVALRNRRSGRQQKNLRRQKQHRGGDTDLKREIDSLVSHTGAKRPSESITQE
jgi:hypothetical protein